MLNIMGPFVGYERPVKGSIGHSYSTPPTQTAPLVSGLLGPIGYETVVQTGVTLVWFGLPTRTVSRPLDARSDREDPKRCDWYGCIEAIRRIRTSNWNDNNDIIMLLLLLLLLEAALEKGHSNVECHSSCYVYTLAWCFSKVEKGNKTWEFLWIFFLFCSPVQRNIG